MAVDVMGMPKAFHIFRGKLSAQCNNEKVIAEVSSVRRDFLRCRINPLNFCLQEPYALPFKKPPAHLGLLKTPPAQQHINFCQAHDKMLIPVNNSYAVLPAKARPEEVCGFETAKAAAKNHN